MRVLDRYVRWLVRHAWLVLALVIAATVFVASGTRQLRTEFSVEASLPTGHPFVRIEPPSVLLPRYDASRAQSG